ncbi:hypothetical protein [uncultured Selenomonas sp.]|uniref:hypothetical protein n=1 Tax=uncultured Selenomonas sp. TaxID=159275 RepID=UPI0028D3E956|nr:hypothetical protein [uncultured Selenomonas sp.]
MSLLIDDYPLIVLPALAEEIGLNEAIFLQQLNYWSQPKLNQGIVDEQGRRWIYNSVEAWRAQFRFFTERTLRRTISNLENLGLILSTLRYKRNPMDRTKSYAICQENVAALECSRNEKQAAAPKRSKPLFNVAPMPDGLTEEEAKGQSVECMWPNWPDAENQASEDFSSDSIKENAAKGQSVECMWPNWPDGSGQNGHMEEEAVKPDAARVEGLSSRAREKTTAKTTTKTTAAAAIDRDGEDTRTRVREEIKTSMAAAEEKEGKYFHACERHGIDEESARRFRQLFGTDSVLEKLPILRDAQKRHRIENPAGWLRCALEGDYRRPALEKEKQHRERIRESAKARQKPKSDPHAKMTDEEILDVIAQLDTQIAAGEGRAGEIAAAAARLAAKRKQTLLAVLEKRKDAQGTRASPEGG